MSMLKRQVWMADDDEFAAILSSFHRRGRRHYIKAVKMFDRKPSMLYTMIVKSLIHCWDNFEVKVQVCWPDADPVTGYKKSFDPKRTKKR